MNKRLHLSERHRAMLLAMLRKHLPGVEVWAYGSRVSGRSHDGSDLDLVLRGPNLEKICEDRLSEFQEAVRESRIPFLVEARDWSRLPERFHREIEREHAVLIFADGVAPTTGQFSKTPQPHSMVAEPAPDSLAKTSKTALVDGHRTIAIDWSGAAKGASSKIWLAEVHQNKLIRLESGRDRAKVINYIIDYASEVPEKIVVGLDFAFSFPQWFTNKQGARSIEDVWKLAEIKGEEWLNKCEPPFWGKPGKSKPESQKHFRNTECQISRTSSINPKSVFQIGGAGTVGTGSIRGMPCLLILRDAGFSIWPFDGAKSCMVIEIYPRLLTGAVNRANYDARVELLREYAEIDTDLAYKAACSEDAFDAAVSAVEMSRQIGDFSSSLSIATDPTKLIEGEIWRPSPSNEQ